MWRPAAVRSPAAAQSLVAADVSLKIPEANLTATAPPNVYKGKHDELQDFFSMDKYFEPYSESRGRIPAATQEPTTTQTCAATQSPATTQGPAATQTGAATQSPATTQRPSCCCLESHCHLEVSPLIRVLLLGASPLPRTPPPLRVPSPSPSSFPLKVLLPPPKVKQLKIEGLPSQHIIPEQFLPPGIPQGTHLPTLAQLILVPLPPLPVPLKVLLTSIQGEAAKIISGKVG
ncbi:hypothetical protein BDZ91DRAFT_804742 [Kalaharituber pfeilii]|nr:hypothetical protein BDZ91DRAFT_804742 [Kalaharituber pfeilii]